MDTTHILLITHIVTLNTFPPIMYTKSGVSTNGALSLLTP